MRSVLLVALAAFSSVLAAPAISDELVIQDGGVHTTASWEWSDCGLFLWTAPLHCLLNYVLFTGTPDDVVQIKSLQVYPDPPAPGHDLTIKVAAVSKQVIEVSD
jgi:hypothetical protein